MRGDYISVTMHLHIYYAYTIMQCTFNQLQLLVKRIDKYSIIYAQLNMHK